MGDVGDPSRSGEDRALRFVAMMLLLQRLSYLVPAAAETSRSKLVYDDPALNVALVAVAVAWNAGLAVVVRLRGWFPPWAVAADVVVICLLLAVSTANLPPEEAYRFINWPTKLVLATAATVGAAAAARWVAPVLLAPVTVHLGVVVALFGSVLMPLGAILDVLNGYFWFALIAHVMRRYLCRQGRALDEATHRQLTLREDQAAERARYGERIAQYRRLHDTVLTTLTAISRGVLDHRAEAVRRRCGTEAAYIRRLIREDAAEGDSALGARLGDVITESGHLGLRVHFLHDRLPAELPGTAVDGLAEASREALNNVLAHSGTREAWLTATGDEGRVLVRIADRGRGFDPGTVSPGFGVRHSILERMREIGGQATVTGAPGDGVHVDLTWPSAQDR